MPSTTFALKALRIAVASCHLMICISSDIVVGITGYFLKVYPHNQHLIFEMCISDIVLSHYLPSFALPLLKSYKSYYLPINFVFKYLFLTAFIFATQDHNESACELHAPFGGSCNLKSTSEAFLFLRFFIMLAAIGVDAYAYLREAVVEAESMHPEKPVENVGAAA